MSRTFLKPKVDPPVHDFQNTYVYFSSILVTMHYFEVAPTKIIRAGSSTFTYASGLDIKIGQIVTIEVGKKILLGIVTRKNSHTPTYVTKSILSVVNETPLPTQLLETALWISSYYATPLALVLQAILPAGLQKKRRDKQKRIPIAVRNRTKNVFTNDQQKALATLDEMGAGSAVLHGVTGSGKTAVYIEAAKRCLAAKRSVTILVPEIALTSQLVDEFSQHFSDIVLTHSKQTEAERHLAWQAVLISEKPQVIIGPRSALFLPVKNLGLIAVDESHEPSYKQEQAPRYSALRVASILAAKHKAKLIMGSATPNIADYYLAKHAHRPIIEMTTRASRDTTEPSIQLIDLTKRTNFTKHRFLSDALIQELETTFESGKQALVFHNRRGSASTTLCGNCSWSAECTRCYIPLTLHADQHHLRCHICNATSTVPTSCPVCHHADIIHKGIGTKLIESELKKLFPKVTIARFDGDTATEETLDKRYSDLYSGSIDLIIGTQVVAKGLDLPELRTVAIIQADAGLSLPDYVSSERTFQLLAQAVGRVGRSHHATNVVVQSYQPSDPAVVYGLSQNYSAFYDITIERRKRALFPPFTHLLQLTCVYKTESAAIANAKKLALELRTKNIKDIQILGPTPAFYERQHDTYRWQLTLKSPTRSSLIEAISYVPTAHWQANLDPASLI